MKQTKKTTTKKETAKIGVFSATTGKRKRVFDRRVDVAKYIGCTQVSVHNALKGKVKTVKGSIVKYIENGEKEVTPVSKDYASHYMKRCAKKAVAKKVATKAQKKPVKRCAKKIGLFSAKTGKKRRVFSTSAEVASFLQVNPSNVCRALNGSHSTCKDYVLKYI